MPIYKSKLVNLIFGVIIVAGIVVMFSLDNPIGAVTILILGAIG